jgi:hypothetical protein
LEFRVSTVEENKERQTISGSSQVKRWHFRLNGNRQGESGSLGLIELRPKRHLNNTRFHLGLTTTPVSISRLSTTRQRDLLHRASLNRENLYFSCFFLSHPDRLRPANSALSPVSSLAVCCPGSAIAPSWLPPLTNHQQEQATVPRQPTRFNLAGCLQPHHPNARNLCIDTDFALMFH